MAGVGEPLCRLGQKRTPLESVAVALLTVEECGVRHP
ncbi:Uncharacterised protein [Mycobacteroides abscessus subsp. abscessus]|nr:Uncharacterised protein [Mycobacteroides abscessus subsp. abscessus]